LKKGEIIIRGNAIMDALEICVLNTGTLDINHRHEGFGIQSTSNRLNLIFGNKASFDIKQFNETFVQATVTIPMN
jgi:LytS/YehU family sensor histidine kinase